MKIAVIGSGISGLASAYWLASNHEITVFEAEKKIGGHTATVDVKVGCRQYAIDTGFIVFNECTYPKFNKLIRELDVQYQPTEMSFSVSDRVGNFEYSGTNANTMLAQRSNLLRPGFWRMINEIRRFNNQAKVDFANNAIDPNLTMGEYLAASQYGREFKQYYILPMASAIWSMPQKTINDFQALFFIRFFNHHGLLNIVNRPQWQVIKGGSREYLTPLTRSFADNIRTDCPVNSITRTTDNVTVKTRFGDENYDGVIFACHSDQALAILGQQATPNERQILSDINYYASDVILHTDISLLPKRRRAWSSWNYLLTGANKDVPLVTYNMNILQGIESRQTFCVSLNPQDHINPEKIIQIFNYSHPQLNAKSIQAQNRWSEINGENRSWFCGAYWGNGFHEDGVASARRVMESIGKGLCQSTLSTAA